MADRRERVADVVESVRAAIEGAQALLHVAMPGIVQSFNVAEMTVTVQPSIRSRILSADGSISSRSMPILVDVPVVFPGGGGYVATFPIAAGDECLVVFGDRCIDSWWQSGGMQEPSENRMHDLSDAFCIVGPCSVPNAVGGISTTKAQLRSVDGSVFVEIDKAGAVKIKAPTSLTLDTPEVIVTGKVTATGEIKSGAIPISTHRHPDAQGGTTGASIP